MLLSVIEGWLNRQLSPISIIQATVPKPTFSDRRDSIIYGANSHYLHFKSYSLLLVASNDAEQLTFSPPRSNRNSDNSE